MQGQLIQSKLVEVLKINFIIVLRSTTPISIWLYLLMFLSRVQEYLTGTYLKMDIVYRNRSLLKILRYLFSNSYEVIWKCLVIFYFDLHNSL